MAIIILVWITTLLLFRVELIQSYLTPTTQDHDPPMLSISRSYYLLWMLPLALLIASPAFSETTTSRYRCSNGAEFSLQGDLNSAVRRNGIRIDLLLGGDSFVLISDNGASNARFVGSMGYKVVLWRENKLMRYGNLLGKKCKELQ